MFRQVLDGQRGGKPHVAMRGDEHRAPRVGADAAPAMLGDSGNQPEIPAGSASSLVAREREAVSDPGPATEVEGPRVA
jgi:hypothetical protein